MTLKMPGQAAKDASANNLEIRDKYAARLKAKMMKAAMRGGDAGGGRGELDASGARVPTHNTKPGAGSLLKYLEQRGLHQAVAMLPGSDPLPELQRAVEFQFKHQLHHEAVLDGEGEVGEAGARRNGDEDGGWARWFGLLSDTQCALALVCPCVLELQPIGDCVFDTDGLHPSSTVQ